MKESNLTILAKNLNLDQEEAYNLMAKTIMTAKNGQQPTPEEITVFAAIASEYNLSPITKEIYAFNNRGIIQPIVSVDGWVKIINTHPQLDGIQFENHFSEGKIAAITCKIYRKDRKYPTEATELLDECFKPTEPWKKWPARMLRHKALIQAARIAFGFSGIVDPDEAERIALVASVEEKAPTVEDVRARYKSMQSKQELRAFLYKLKKEQPLVASQVAREIADFAEEKPEVEVLLNDEV